MSALLAKAKKAGAPPSKRKGKYHEEFEAIQELTGKHWSVADASRWVADQQKLSEEDAEKLHVAARNRLSRAAKKAKAKANA